MSAGVRKWGVVAVLAGAIFGCDQATKDQVQKRIRHTEMITVIECCFNWTHVHNRGGAFGMFSDSRSTWGRRIFAAASFGALGFLVYLIAVAPPQPRGQILALAAILGGAVGNLFDRVRQGFVVDFIDVHVGNWHWPSFNVADIAITLGIIFILAEMVFRPKQPSPPAFHQPPNISPQGGEG